MTPDARRIFKAVRDQMQNAEEIGGPEGADYDALMLAIETEARERRQTRQAIERADQAIDG